MSQGYVPLWARRFPLPETLPVPFNIFQLAPHRIAEHIDTPISWVAPQMAADNGRQPIQPGVHAGRAAHKTDTFPTHATFVSPGCNMHDLSQQ